ncbi:MAG: transglutaminase domain-containing protein, partial [Gammaproteobacteria bacterium]|nr:transglutaminase domain-containing protein [Gammaproteobacteria bacterium]
AWTEVWLGDDGGWVRVDPTSAVSPSRVTQGIESALPDTLINVPPGIFNNGFSRDVWENMSNTFDAINNRWNQWVLGYDRNRQRFFLSQLGLGNLGREELMIGLAVMLIVCLVVICYGMFGRTAIKSDKAKTWYEKFRQRLSSCGIQIYDHEGPQDLAIRAAKQRKDLAAAINEICQTYINVRYKGQLELLNKLEHQIRLFKPAKSPG